MIDLRHLVGLLYQSRYNKKLCLCFLYYITGTIDYKKIDTRLQCQVNKVVYTYFCNFGRINIFIVHCIYNCLFSRFSCLLPLTKQLLLIFSGDLGLRCKHSNISLYYIFKRALSSKDYLFVLFRDVGIGLTISVKFDMSGFSRANNRAGMVFIPGKP